MFVIIVLMWFNKKQRWFWSLVTVRVTECIVWRKKKKLILGFWSCKFGMSNWWNVVSKSKNSL